MEVAQLWTCSTCTFANGIGATQCEICGASQPGAWRCSGCTFVNGAETLACGACGSLLPPQRSATGKKGKKGQRFRSADHLLGTQLPSAAARRLVAESDVLEDEAWEEREEMDEWSSPQKAASHARGRFVQASCRAVVGTGDKGWRDIWHMDQACGEVPRCPICLEEPFLPRISECGHILCLACVVRHLQIKHTCPICSVGPILLGDLRSVTFEVVQRPLAGGDWTFVLVRRSGDRIALASHRPKAAATSASDQSHLAREGEPGWRYSRRVLGNPSTRLERMRAEIQQLEASDDPALVSVRDLLQDQLVKAAEDVADDAPEPLLPRGPSSIHDATATPMLFYQSEDAQLIFLEPALTKQLLERYGDWGSLPQQVKLQQVDGFRQEIVTEDLQWRHRFLSHLQGSEVIFVGGSIAVDGTQPEVVPLEGSC